MTIDCVTCKTVCKPGPVEKGPNVAGQMAHDPYRKGWKEKATKGTDHVPYVCPKCGKTKGYGKA